jgi:uncharacterized membrane protein
MRHRILNRTVNSSYLLQQLKSSDLQIFQYDYHLVNIKLNRRATMAKTTTFAVMHFSVAFSVAYLLTGDVVIGGAVALIEPAVNTVAFYFHERAWSAHERSKHSLPNGLARTA